MPVITARMKKLPPTAIAMMALVERWLDEEDVGIPPEPELVPVGTALLLPGVVEEDGAGVGAPPATEPTKTDEVVVGVPGLKRPSSSS